MLVDKTNKFSCNSTGVASSSSVSRSESKETNLKKRVLLNTKSKRTPNNVKKSQSSFTSVANKNDTINSNVSDSKTNVLKAKTVNAVHDGLNLVCVSCGKDVFMISHDKCVARYALSSNSRVKIALFTSPVAAKSRKLEDTHVRNSWAQSALEMITSLQSLDMEIMFKAILLYVTYIMPKALDTIFSQSDNFVMEILK
ncbi:hypothetical protein Tco_0810327 [Tanacetum coccineum]